MKNKIILNDCIKEMKKMKNKAVDHIITDIPYDVVSRESNGLRKLDKEEADILTFDLKDFIEQCVRVVKDKVMIFCSSEQVSIISKLLNEKGFETDLAIWSKTNPSPVNGQYIWLSGIECCVVGNKGKIKKELQNIVWETSNGRSKIHPTEKPLNLLSLIIKEHTKEGDIILDPCAGSGSTLEAAALQQRHWIGIEIFEKYFNDIKIRMNKYK